MSIAAIAPLISAGLSFIGGRMNQSSQDEFNQQQLQMAQRNLDQQREFAQHGIRWRVEDATAAGLHPLAALGAQTSSFSPVSLGGSASTGMGDALSSVGQDIGRSIKAATTREEREERDVNTARKLQLEKGALENDLLKTELVSKMRREAAAIGPAFPGGVPMPRPGPRRTPMGEAVREDDLKQTIEDQPSPESGRPFGFQMKYNPLFGSGQAFEDRYGDSEIAQTLKFLVNMGGDLWSTGSDWLGPIHPNRGAAARRRRQSRPWGE